MRKKDCTGNQFIVYDDYAGIVLKVSFLGDKWWVTTPGEKLQTLSDYLEGDTDVAFRLLCTPGDKVGALALAKVLGKALENPEISVERSMMQRVDRLKRLGISLDVKDEKLMLELEVFKNPAGSPRHGKYSAWCYVAGCFDELLFDIDGFNTKADAEDWVYRYFDILDNIGIQCKIV